MIPLRDDNPTRSTPFLTVVLIAANVLVYLYEMTLPPDALRAFVMQLGVIPSELTVGGGGGSDLPFAATLFTSMFLHGSLMHLAGNMLYLWIFGNNIEDSAGPVRYLIFYLACGVAAAATQIAASPRSDVPMIGASGAIAGVLGAYAVLFPHARVLTLVPIFIIIRLVYLPAIVVLGLWFLYQILLSSADTPADGGVAFFAHIGGFVAGMILIWPMRRRRPARPRRVRFDEDDL